MTPNSPIIAITGATGNIGRAVSDQLARAGARLRLVVRNPDRAPAGFGDIVQAGYGDGWVAPGVPA